MTSRSTPRAMPPCGGAPLRRALRRKPNFSCASSGRKPEQSEDLGLNQMIMTANRAAAAFLAVDHQVVGLGANRGRARSRADAGLRRAAS